MNPSASPVLSPVLTEAVAPRSLPRRRVTQTDIARAAGVHNATVSLALRNSALIPLATRLRIQRIAERLGYRPDPFLHALGTQRRSGRGHRALGTIAFFTGGCTEESWRERPCHQRTFSAAFRRAADLGYRLEPIWIENTAIAGERLSALLAERDIAGVILGPGESAATTDVAALDWSRLCGVQLGWFPGLPPLPRVKVDELGAVRTALRQVRATGATRVGLVVARAWDDEAQQAWSSHFAFEQFSQGRWQENSVLRLAGDSPAAALRAWRDEFQPDAILGLAPAFRALLALAGLAVSDDLIAVNLDAPANESGLPGICLSHERVGELAVEILVARLSHCDFGAPDNSTTMAIAGAWVDGRSA